MHNRLVASFLVALIPTIFAAAQEAPLPRPKHVVIVIEENKAYDDVIGKAAALYINSLVRDGAVLTNYHGLHHPSQPNYVELFSGNEQGVCTDKCPKKLINARNLATLLAKQGFVGFAEDLPKDLSKCTAGHYVRRHCPWLDFKGIPGSVSQDFSKFPTKESDFDNLPAVSIVIPNLVDDMHGLKVLEDEEDIPVNVKNGDRWLSDKLGAYAKWAMTHNSLLVVTWDEDSSRYLPVTSCEHGHNTKPPKNLIPTIIVGQPVMAGSESATEYTHYNLLRTIEDMYDLPAIGGSAAVRAISGIWK